MERESLFPPPRFQFTPFAIVVHVVFKVDSTLHNSTASSFRQSARMQSSRDAGVPGPGSYKAISSLGHQASGQHRSLKKVRL